MTTNYHTPWQDGITDYNEADMNAPLEDLDAQITQNVSDIVTHIHNLAHSFGPYDIGGTLVGKPISGEVILRYPTPRVITFPEDMEDSQMVSSVVANAPAVFSLKKGGVEFATATFAAASSVAVIACPAELAFAKGDILTLVSPNPQDVTLEDIGWAFVAIREAEATTTTTTTTTSTSSTSSTSSSTSSTSSTISTTSSTSSTAPPP